MVPQPQQLATPSHPSINVPFFGNNIVKRKRKAFSAPEGNERLSKRLSLLHLDRDGVRTYFPLESTQSALTATSTQAVLPQFEADAAPTQDPICCSSLPRLQQPPSSIALAKGARTPIRSVAPGANVGDIGPVFPSTVKPTVVSPGMQLDDTRYKVYIYNIDEELAEPPSESLACPSEAGQLTILPDLEKHIKAAMRKPPVPQPVFPSTDAELADMQLVLYQDPRSISVSRENDGVRKAIMDARARIRRRQSEQQELKTSSAVPASLQPPDIITYNGTDPDCMEID